MPILIYSSHLECSLFGCCGVGSYFSLVPDNILQLSHNHHPFVTRRILILDVVIALYLITLFFLFLYILHYMFSTVEGPVVGACCHHSPAVSGCTGGT